MSSARDFFSELRRRKVIRTLVVYAALAWAGIEGVTTLGPVFGASDTMVRALVVVILAGLPVAVVLSWMFDITPEGVKADERSAGKRADPTPPPAATAPPEGPMLRPPLTPATDLIGREDDVESIAGRFDVGARMVTILGPGGTGKTRLATALYERLVDSFSGGAGFVSLAGVDQAGEVMPFVALAFDLAEVEGRTPVEGLAKAFEAREYLLILDNLEHVLTSRRKWPSSCRRRRGSGSSPRAGHP